MIDRRVFRSCKNRINVLCILLTIYCNLPLTKTAVCFAIIITNVVIWAEIVVIIHCQIWHYFFKINRDTTIWVTKDIIFYGDVFHQISNG